MKNKIGYMLVLLLIISTFQGLNTTARNENEHVSSRDFSHTVLVEVASSQSCKPCHYWSETIQDIYESGDYDFHYVEMIIFDYNDEKLNKEAADWYKYYNAGSIPKNIMDGDYRRIGNQSEKFIEYLNDCGNRAVADITAKMTTMWLGNATIQVDISIENNEASEYNGHIRASISEIVSRYNTFYGEPFHFGFLGFAFDMDISIPAQGKYEDSMTWNGNEHQDNHGNDFGDIEPRNIQLTMGVINNINGYVDGTVISHIDSNDPPDIPENPNPKGGATDVDINADLSWTCSDPDGDDLTYDVYFEADDSTPDGLVSNNQSASYYDPGTMYYDTHYYWKIVAWDEFGAYNSSPVWDFTTGSEPNNPPNSPKSPNPDDDEIDVDIDTDLSWLCSDPDGDDLVYDVYFEAYDSDPDVLVSDDQSETTFDPGTMGYGIDYYWKIVAKDEHGASTTGPVWSFQSETKIPDNNPPKVKITKPERGLYFRDKKILPRFIRFTLIIGKMPIEVNATDEGSGIEKVEFYINGKLRETDISEPYEYLWERDRLRFFHFFKIKVIAYDKEGNFSEDSIFVRKYI